MNHFETTILGRLVEPALSLRLTLALAAFPLARRALGIVALSADRRCDVRRPAAVTRYLPAFW